jgi:hypothetical protein
VDGIDGGSSANLPQFEGDVAIKALRHRLSLDPEFLSAPPVRHRSYMMPTIGRMLLVVVVAAIVAGGITLLSLPDTRSAIFKRDFGSAMAPLLVALPGAPQSTPQALPQAQPQLQLQLQPSPRLVIEGRQTFANEALALGISLNGATGAEVALLTGLASGTRLSVGGPFGTNGWRIPARELATALAYAPKDFVGVMDTAVDLRLPNDTLIDSQVMRLEWVAKQPEIRAVPQRPDREEARAVGAFRPLDAVEVEALVKRGQDYMKIGDITSARLALRRAVSAGSAQAAFALGATFDPVVLGELGVLGFAPDAAQARAWYQRAAELGSTEASRRIERLAKPAN